MLELELTPCPSQSPTCFEWCVAVVLRRQTSTLTSDVISDHLYTTLDDLSSTFLAISFYTLDVVGVPEGPVRTKTSTASVRGADRVEARRY